MYLKVADVVKLLPTWTFPQGRSAPVWGGPFGYHIGTVEKTETHEHDKSKHTAIIRWSTGEAASMPERYLAIATNDEKDVALDARGPSGPVDRDIFVLLRTSQGNFSLNVIEATALSKESGASKYIAGITRRALSVQNSNYNVVGTMLSQSDYVEAQTSALFTAAQQIFHSWDLPTLESLPLPLPEFLSVKDAVALAPSVGAGVLFFHLPQNLMDYADTPPTLQALAS